jgi:hypothetical protein
VYKVVYYPTQSETILNFKWFETFTEANEFAMKIGENIIEIKKYDNQTNNIQD